jgi:hypothetical protein
MAHSTGVILAVGGISFGNEWLLNKQPPNFKILLATGVAALMLGGLEHLSEPLATGIAWIALITVTLTDAGSKGNSPAQNLLNVTGL